MRRTNSSLLLLLSLALLVATAAHAEPILRGFQLPSDRGKTAAPAKSDRGVILAHVFNSDSLPLEHGKYEIGLELRGGGKAKTFVVKPARSIAAGEIRTFRLQIPRGELEKNYAFRVFSRAEGKASFSEEYPLGVVLAGGKTKVTTLYTEAPPEPASDLPPKEIPFEGEVPAAVAKAPKAPVAPKAPASPAGPAAPAVPSKAPKTGPETPAATEAPRSIDANEFKPLRTIDEELVIYVVKKGDTLRNVAARYYGDPAKEKKIMELNFIDNPQGVRVGEEIIVDVRPLERSSSIPLAKPAKADHAATAKGTSKKASPAKSEAASGVETAVGADGSRTYVIQTGDTLGKIAKNLLGKTTRASQILQANPGLNPKNLKVGTMIVIPAGKGEKA